MQAGIFVKPKTGSKGLFTWREEDPKTRKILEQLFVSAKVLKLNRMEKIYGARKIRLPGSSTLHETVPKLGE